MRDLYFQRLLKELDNNKNEKIFFWGASLFLKEFLKKYNVSKYNIIGIIEKAPEKWGQNLCNYEIFSSDILNKYDKCKVILTIFNRSWQRYFELKDFLFNNYSHIDLADIVYRTCEEELKEWYFQKTGEVLNLSNPRTYNEKIQWLKLYDSTPIKTQLADKFLVREWIKEKIGKKYLIPLLGVWDKFDDIDFDKLPNQFVLKCNHGCGYNIIVKDKTKLNIKNARNKVSTWMQENFAYTKGLEMQYSAIPRKIFAEEYIEPSKSIYEIQAWCFEGKLHFISFETNKNEEKICRQIYLPNWEKANFKINPNYNEFEIAPEKPRYLEELISIVEILAKDFKHVRIDFVPINDEIFFREMTFTSGSGCLKFFPEEMNYKIGELILL